MLLAGELLLTELKLIDLFNFFLLDLDLDLGERSGSKAMGLAFKESGLSSLG